jgi:hypothetical protein
VKRRRPAQASAARAAHQNVGRLERMRDYLYVWHDLEQHALVASGIEFNDLLPSLSSQGGVLLLEHESETAAHDSASSFSFVNVERLPEFATEDIYSWGNFVWVDYAHRQSLSVSDEEVAELLFFAHKARPLRRISLPSLENKFLAYAHDDGWYLRLYYSDWQNVEALLVRSVPTLGAQHLSELKQGVHGFWIRGGQVKEEEKTDDVDRVLNRWL